ncbi:DUF3291 domain-containing protein [Marinobacterium jannaschii]|uniref:DUF3291 domain-containing protein n=1 Tax=Marinobacterium jannaschii TaxID=64970 RepID=UPI00048742E1|nr:DUF3291 domain-containing protein [Marinobacterium jannaschii]
MSQYHLAQLNLGTPLYPLDDPRISAFVDALERINALAENSPGFIWRLKDESDNATAIEVPGYPDTIFNLSVWQDFSAFREFVYRSEHAQFIKRRKEWFRPMETPPLMMWWVKVDEHPTLEDAIARYDQLCRSGPGQEAFTLGTMFAPPDLHTTQA